MFKKEGKKVKLIFKYPEYATTTVKSGIILQVFDDCFIFDEKFDGKVAYGYSFLEEIKEVKL